MSTASGRHVAPSYDCPARPSRACPHRLQDVANLLVPKPTRESNMRRVIAHVHQFDAILQRDTMQRLHDLLGGPAFVTQACKTYPKKQFKTEGHVRLLSEEERALVRQGGGR